MEGTPVGLRHKKQAEDVQPVGWDATDGGEEKLSLIYFIRDE